MREQINALRMRGIEPKACWISQYSADCMHAMWHEIAGYYDEKLPDVIASVPVAVGAGIGRDDFAFEYDSDTTAAHTLRRPAVANPLPDND